MTDAVETMAYAKTGGVPWHGMGEPVSNKLTPDQMQKAAKIDWTVSKRDIYWKPDGKVEVLIEDKKMLTRDSDNQALSMVGVDWKPVQNGVAVDFMAKFVKEGKMEMETMGSLWSGRYIWALARIKKDFSIGGKGTQADEIRPYLLLCSPHVLGHAMNILYTPIRVVCWNTLTAALRGSASSKTKNNHVFSMPHSMEFNEYTKEQAAIALNLAVEQTTEFKQIAQVLSKKRITEQKTEEFFNDVMQFDPEKAKKDGKPTPRIIKYFNEALLAAPGQDLATAQGTWWGALNAVTHVVDHKLGRERETALRSAWFGQKAGYKRRALDLAMQGAKA